MSQQATTGAASRTRPKAIFFDLDQTLLQHTFSIQSYARRVLLEIAPEHPSNQIDLFEKKLSASAGEVWGRVAEWSGRGEEILAQTFSDALIAAGYAPRIASQVLQMVLQRTADSTELTRGTIETFDGLAAFGIKLGIITNGFTIFQRQKALRHGLLDRVRAIVTSEDAGAHKPDRRIFELALKALDVHAAEAWYVGDSVDKDIRGAAGAGITSVLFDPEREFSPEAIPSSSAQPHYIIHELPDLLGRVSTA